MPAHENNLPTESTCITRRSLLTAAAGVVVSAATPSKTAHASPAPSASTPSEAFVPLDVYLGASKRIVDELSAHEHDSYYLSTPFGNTGPNGEGGSIDSWDCWHPNGRPKENGQSYMNCAGFLVAVFEACGADCDIVGSYVGSSGYNRGNKANLSRWKCFLDDHASMKKEYRSKEELLSSGQLRKGDIIIAEPNDWNAPGADCHVMFFWGDSPSEDKAWHSTSHADGVVAGTVPGNAISLISAKHADCYWIHAPLENLIDVTVRKTSADISIADGTEEGSYSLEGASFSVFESFDGEELSGLIASFTTDANGSAAVSLPPNCDVWIREDEAPLGFAPWSEPKRFHVERGSETMELADNPCTVRLILKKIDGETNSGAQGHASLEGALYELVDSKGKVHQAKTAWDESYKAWAAVFEKLPRGKARIREVQPSPGYVLDDYGGSGHDGWMEIELTPDSHELEFEMPVHEHAEQIVRGDICGAKYDGSNVEEIRSPLADCEFAFWLEDDGSLEEKGHEVTEVLDAFGLPIKNGDGTVLKGAYVGSVTSGADGRFSSRSLASPESSKDLQKRGALVYGSYTLVETSCPNPSLALLEPICHIEVHAEGQEVFFILEDRLIASPVRIRKTDAASGKTIGKPGTLIELLRKGEDGAYEVMEFDAHYPDSHKVSVFSIPASGIVQFPEKLAYGSYAIREVEAVAPYLLRTEPIYFEVSKEHDWASDDLLEIDLPNEAATGTIRAAKIDAESKEAIAGACYEIIAKDDITTPDGTVHYKKGNVVQTVETDEQGAWTVEGLPLGNGSVTYLVVETATPDGYVAESEPREVTLSYESQTAAIVEGNITIEEQPCRLVATKKDKASKEPIEGVVFDVYRTERSSAIEEDAPFLSASTDSEGKAVFSKLPRDATYRIVEAESRIDLGYPTQHAEAALYLSPDGRWYSDFAAYEEENAASTQAQDQKQEQKEDEPDQSHQEAAPHGAIEGSVALENDFTKVSIFKVDRDAYQNMNRNQAEESETLRQGSDIREALLEGGEFELVDEKGDPVPCAEGISRWSASPQEPQTFTRLVPGAEYTIVEHQAPSGYRRAKDATTFRVEDTSEVQVVIVENEEEPATPFAKTADWGSSAATISGVLAAGSAAYLWYARRRASLEEGS